MNKMNHILSILKGIREDSDFENSNNFIEDGLFDSFDIVNLSGELEENFGITIEAEDIIPENFISIISIEKLIEKCGKV